MQHIYCCQTDVTPAEGYVENKVVSYVCVTLKTQNKNDIHHVKSVLFYFKEDQP